MLRHPPTVRPAARRALPQIVTVIAGLTLVACSGGQSRAASLSTGSAVLALAPAGQRYGAIVAPFAGAVDRFASASGALPLGASVDDFEAIAQPFADTVGAIEIQLRQVNWPSVALEDIKAELAADQSLIDDLTGTSDVTLILSLWRQQIVGAAGKVSRTKRRVATDLGLDAP
jgi:hypothetical protein